jgi:hypothetical protein
VLISVVAVVVVPALIGFFVIAVVANRAGPDPSRRRPQRVYCFAVSFVTIQTDSSAATTVPSPTQWRAPSCSVAS